jgi:hypothetical protein
VKLFGPAQLRTLPRLAETQSATRKKRKQGGHNRHKYPQRALVLSKLLYIGYAVSTHRLPAMQRPAPGRPRGTDAASSLRTAADPPIVNDKASLNNKCPDLYFLGVDFVIPLTMEFISLD